MAAQCNAGVRLLFRSHVQTLRQKRSLFRSWVQWELCRRESLVLRSSERTAGWEWILQTCQWCCREKPEQEIRWYWITGSNRTAVYDVWSQTEEQTERGDVLLLSQQVAHTQRVLPGWIWSQSVRAAGHSVLSLRKPLRFTVTFQSIGTMQARDN